METTNVLCPGAENSAFNKGQERGRGLVVAGRPETAPFCPAWNGSRTAAERALRLIAKGGLDGGGTSVEALAARVGVGTRHLCRFFEKRIGASPARVAKTARVQRAKRLLDGTDLPMAEVAMRSGFGSLRRFNAAFAEVHRRPPTAIRRRRQSD